MSNEVANHETYKSVLERLKTSLNTIFCLINRILQKIFTRMR
nr:MAG TPA: NITRATE/NITRITE RESPONSE REGULATOR PROTEIN NARL REGULATORS, TWO-COMPONENT SYSTEMS, SIGNAL [Caudoviricetes sp.]